MQSGQSHRFAVRPIRRARSLGVASLLGAGALAVGIAGCGSSNKSSSSSSSSSSASASASNTAKAHPSVVPAVASPSGAKALTSLKQLPKVPRGTSLAPHIVGFSNVPIATVIPTISADINKFWSGLAAQANLQWPQVSETLVQTSPASTQCSSNPTVQPTDPIFICAAAPNSGASTAIYWTVPFMQQKVDTDPGRVNLAFTMAMIWSFQVQNVTGALQALQSNQMTKGAFAQENVCLTGVYVNSLNDRKMFEQGDSTAVQNFLNNLTQTFGIGSPDVTPQQLQQAFIQGFNTGDPSQCASGGGGGGTTTTSTTANPTSSTTSTPGLTTTTP
jgi:predicted metalloprotease